MNLQTETIELLKKHGLYTQKRLGQNFLISEKTLNKIVEAGDIKPTDTVIEIGPGLGTLTKELVKKAGKVISIEKDQRLKEVLKNYPVIFEDALNYNPEQIEGNYKLIANIPYYITSPIINQFLKSEFLKKDKGHPPTLIVLLIQKEVAEKICNPKRESYLSMGVKSFGTPSIVAKVPKTHFFPSPKVDSAILKIEVGIHPALKNIDLKKYFQILSIGFSKPRKKVRNNIKGIGITEENTNVDLQKRPEELTIEEWSELTSNM